MMFKFFIGFIFASSNLIASAQQLNHEQRAIQTLIGNTYDQANSKVQISPIVTARDYAIADWIQGGKGGRALLKKTNGTWEITMCGGQGLTVTKNLVDIGIPSEQAKQLTSALKIAESKLDQQKIKLFDSFGKTISFKDMHHAENSNKNQETKQNPHHP